MQRVGLNLANKLEKTKDIQISVENTLQVGLQNLEIIKDIHNHGIIHGDIKVDNVCTGLIDDSLFTIKI